MRNEHPVTYLPREGWDSSGAARRGDVIAPGLRTSVIIHHTVTIDSDATPNTWETVDEAIAHMRRLRTIRPDLGADVPYNGVVFAMAAGGLVVAEGRGLYRSGAHTPAGGRNRSGLGFAFAGNYEDQRPPDALEDRLAAFGDWLVGLRRIGFVNLGTDRPEHGRATVYGHHDTKATACPGRFLIERLDWIDL